MGGEVIVSSLLSPEGLYLRVEYEKFHLAEKIFKA